MKRLRFIFALVTALVILSGCVYYNTFYHARKAFNQAESQRKSSTRKGSGKAGGGNYSKAIEKSQKVLDKYPNSGWYDDALFVNGVSNYYTGDYNKAERRFRELIANYPKSDYVKESRIYLAKTQLQLGEEQDAMSMFEELYQESRDKNIKAEAAMALGEYYFDQKNYTDGEKYFLALVDSLGDEGARRTAQMYIADGYYTRYNYRSALQNYLKILDINPTLEEQFRVNYRAAECSFYLNEIDDGMGYLEKLSANSLFYDSLATIKLLVAFGHEMNGDIALAEKVYKDVAEEKKPQQSALANYNLGLIYQFDYENYRKAKEYYDKAKLAGSSSGIYHDALQRSTDIGKLEEYSKDFELDSSATRDEINNAARTQYLLAELYYAQLGKPDSAMQEFRYVVEQFPQTYMAPKALIAMAVMMRDNYDDTLGYDSTLRRVLRDYPRSDFVPEALDLLGLRGTRADTGYAELYYRQAEKYLLDSLNVDSAIYYFSLVADSFPDSKYNEQAAFARLWAAEQYAPPGDSSLYFAFVNFADSFPQSVYTKEIRKALTVRPKRTADAGGTEDAAADSASISITADSAAADTTQKRVLTSEERCATGPDGNTIFPVQGSPMRFDKEFKYPPAAYVTNFEGSLCFQIRIDPFGDVIDVKLVNGSPSEELNQEAFETVQGSHWDTRWIPPELFDSWFVYKYDVRLPRSLK